MTPEQLDEATDRTITNAIVSGRNIALDAVIEILEHAAANGGSVADCLVIVRDLQAKMNQLRPAPAMLS